MSAGEFSRKGVFSRSTKSTIVDDVSRLFKEAERDALERTRISWFGFVLKCDFLDFFFTHTVKVTYEN